MDWKFCPYCAGALTDNDAHSLKCTQCGKLHYFNPKSTVGVMFFKDDGKLVFSIRGREPWKGMLDIVGGYVDLGESIEEALTREIAEETGLTTAEYSTPLYLGSIFADYTFMGYNVPHTVSIFVSRLHGEPKPGDDVESFVELSVGEIDPSKFGVPDYMKYLDKALKLYAIEQ